MNQHQCVSVQHVHWDLSALDILSIHHRYIVSWNAHKGRLGVGFRGEGGKNYFPQSEPYGALEARQGSSIFSEWSHHLTVKDRCLLEQKPWHRKQPVQLSCSLQTTLRILYSPCYCQTSFANPPTSINHIHLVHWFSRASEQQQQHVITRSTDGTAVASLAAEKTQGSWWIRSWKPSQCNPLKCLPKAQTPGRRWSFCYLRVVKI